MAAKGAAPVLGFGMILHHGEMAQKGIERRGREGGIGSLGDDGKKRALLQVRLEQVCHAAGGEFLPAHMNREMALKAIRAPDQIASEAGMQPMVVADAGFQHGAFTGVGCFLKESWHGRRVG